MQNGLDKEKLCKRRTLGRIRKTSHECVLKTKADYMLSIITGLNRGYNRFEQAPLKKSISDAYLASPPAWASLHQRGFPQSPSATRPCWGRWHASSAPMSHQRSSHRASGSHPAPSCRACIESEGKGGHELEQNSQNTQTEQIWGKTSTCKDSKMDFQTWGSFFWVLGITSTFILRVVEGLWTDK